MNTQKYEVDNLRNELNKLVDEKQGNFLNQEVQELSQKLDQKILNNIKEQIK